MPAEEKSGDQRLPSDSALLGGLNPHRREGRLRDWFEAHLPKLVGLWDWPRYRLFSRCWACRRLMVLHSPWALYICERTPLPIRITEQGIARAAELAGESSDPVVPMSHAASA